MHKEEYYGWGYVNFKTVKVGELFRDKKARKTSRVNGGTGAIVSGMMPRDSVLSLK